MFVSNVRCAGLGTAIFLALLGVAVPAGAQEGVNRQTDNPLDRLRAEDIPEYERRVAEIRNHGRLPEGLVAIFGDSRWQQANLAVDLAVTPDGARCVTAGGSSLVLWDLQTGQALRVMSQTFRRQMLTVSLSGDGRAVAAGDSSGNVTLWDLPEGQLRRRLATRGGVVALSRDGQTIVTADNGQGDIGFWGAVTGRFEMTSSDRALLAQPRQHLDARLASILLWDTETGLPLKTLECTTTQQLRSIVVSESGESLAMCCADGSVRLWDMAERRLHWKCRPVPDVSALDVQFSPDGRTVWVLTTSHLVPIDVILGRAGVPVAVPDGTACFDFLPGEERAVIACGGLRILHLPTGKLGSPFEPAAHSGKLISAAFSPAGDRLAAGGDDGSIIVWDVATRRPLFRSTEHTAPVPALAWSPDGSLLATGDEQGLLMFWETAMGRKIASRHGPRSIQRLAFDSEGRRLAVAAAHGDIDLWDLAEWKATRTADQWGRSQTITNFLPEGQSLLTSGGIVNIKSGQFVRTFPRADAVSAASADGTRGIARGLLRDLATGNAIADLSAGGLLKTAMFSPDGRSIAGVTTQGRMLLWDADTGTELWRQEFVDSGTTANSLAFSHNGRYLAYPAGNGTVHIVRLPLPGDDRTVSE
jgi:WD40 repeat protein